MWVISEFGFFSVVGKPGDRETVMLTVRARVKADLEALRKTCLPTLGPIGISCTIDYRYRAKATRVEVAAAMAQAVQNIGYDNFKSKVKKQQGAPRAEVYGLVWEDLLALQR
ncbi:MAG: hypothetical protein JWP29_4657 [Rhodoferax sp.]|nr:hypothetical protein [Rhodoferax sp.]